MSATRACAQVRSNYLTAHFEPDPAPICGQHTLDVSLSTEACVAQFVTADTFVHKLCTVGFESHRDWHLPQPGWQSPV